MCRLVIGIDPGKTGAVVALDRAGRPVEWMAADEPGGYCLKGNYSPRVLWDWLGDLTTAHEVDLVVIEKQSVRPIEARRACLTTGQGEGMLWGGVTAMGLPCERVSPAKWSRAIFGSTKAGSSTARKARAVALCQDRIPALPLTWGRRTKQHTGLADAALLALYGLQQLPV